MAICREALGGFCDVLRIAEINSKFQSVTTSAREIPKPAPRKRIKPLRGMEKKLDILT